MAFNNTLLTALDKKTANPILLLQLNILQPWEDFIVDSAGIWKFSTLTNTYDGIDTEITENFPLLNVIGIGDVIVDGVSLPEVTSYTNTIDGRATALASQPSFIFDGANDVLYCRFDTNYNPPLSQSITIGAILGLADKEYYDYVNNITYIPDLKNSPNLSQQKDPIFFETLRFNNFNQQINNAHYKYDEYKTAGIFGSLAKYYLGERSLDFEYFEQVYQGRVSRYSYNRDTWTVNIRDSRKALSNTIPLRAISATTYPDADDYASSTPVPFLYGNVTDVPCISLNENEDPAPSTYVFLFADTTDFDVDVSSYTIKVDGLEVTPSTVPDGTTGLFAIATADYEPGQTVTYSGGGYLDGTPALISNQLDIAKHLIENYANIVYNSTNFNTTEWDAETLKASDNVGVAITDITSVIKVLEGLASTGAAGFLVDPDGRYTWRTFDSATDPVITIKDNEWQNHPKLVGDSEEVLSSATVKYDQSISLGRWKRQTDDSKEAQVKQDYNIERNREFGTLYSAEADALTFAETIMSKSDTVQDVIEAEVLLSKIEGQIGQNAQIELNHTDGTEWLGKLKCEILETSPNVGNNRLRIKLRAFEELEDFTFIHDFNGTIEEIFDFNGTDIIDYNG